MKVKPFTVYVLLPTLAFAGYFAGLQFLPVFTKRLLHSEHGAIEWGTAVAFFVAAFLGARLLWKTQGMAPAWCRVLYGVFAAAGLMVALEEISYGQKLFDWNSPEWFAEHNAKSETNLHNMFHNKPSNYLRAAATVGCPVCCLVLPVWLRRRGRGMQAGEWGHYLLPQAELATMAVLTLLLTLFNKIPSIKGMATWTGHLGELKELYWGVVAVCYANILLRRITASHESGTTAEPHGQPCSHRKAA